MIVETAISPAKPISIDAIFPKRSTAGEAMGAYRTRASNSNITTTV